MLKPDRPKTNFMKKRFNFQNKICRLTRMHFNRVGRLLGTRLPEKRKCKTKRELWERECSKRHGCGRKVKQYDFKFLPRFKRFYIQKPG